MNIANIDFKKAEPVLSAVSGLLEPSQGAVVKPMPLPVTLTGGPLKPGLSATDIASRIISRQTQALQMEDNILEAGGMAEAMEIIRCDEIVKAIQTKMRIDTVSIDPVSGLNKGFAQAL